MHYNLREFITQFPWEANVNASSLLQNMTPISELSRGGAAKVFERLADETPQTIIRNNKPIGVILTPAAFSRLLETEENYLLLCEAMDRMEKEGDAPTTSLRDLAKDDKIGQAELDAVGEVEFE